MKVRIELVFEGVDPVSERGLRIVGEVCESAETIRIGFDADDVLVDTNMEDEEWAG